MLHCADATISTPVLASLLARTGLAVMAGDGPDRSRGDDFTLRTWERYHRFAGMSRRGGRGAANSRASGVATRQKCPAKGRPRRKGLIERKEQRAAYLFLSPWLIGLAAFWLIPIIASLALSFSEWNILGLPKMARARQLPGDALRRPGPLGLDQGDAQ
jgi:hypothetical protein